MKTYFVELYNYKNKTSLPYGIFQANNRWDILKSVLTDDTINFDQSINVVIKNF